MCIRDRKRGTVETPVVPDPAKKHRTGPSGNIPQVEIAAMMQLPAAHNLAHRLGRFVANRRRETDEQIASAIHRLPGSKRKSQKIESLLWMTVQPVRILAVNNLRLLRVQFEFAHRKPGFQRLSQRTRLRFTATVTDDVIGIALKRDVWIVFFHPTIKRIVKEKISQDRAHYSPLRGPLLSAYQRAIRHAHRRPEPSFDVEQHPCAIGMTTHRSHQQLPIDVVEEAFDVEIEHPVMTPASLPCHSQCIVRRPTGTIPIRVLMEHWFHKRLQVSLDHRLGDSVRNRRDTQRPRSTIAFRDVYPSDWRRQVTACRATIKVRRQRQSG